jgi:hypothetical protein
MDATHVHLILNQVPALGVVFAGLLLGVALRYRSAPFQRLALLVMVGCALVAVTGEGAGEAVAAGLLALAVTTTGLFTWTGYLGGQIRHTELGSLGTAMDRRGAEDDD